MTIGGIPSTTPKLLREISNARLRVFEGVGHLAFAERAAEV